jgi:glyoxylase-like metal-dependent hydrolase (beta-lactamase superfamily II)
MLRQLSFVWIFVFVFFFLTTSAAADSGDVSIEKITGRLYLVTFQKPFMTHSIVLESDAGLLLADTGFGSTAEEFRNLLKSKFNKKVLYIITSHYHADHIGGNPLFSNATVIAQTNTSKRLTEYYHLPRLSGDGMPNLVFDDRMDLYFGGVQVQLRYMPDATTDGDIIVYFPMENILWLADAIAPDNYTYCDVRANGDPLGLIKNINLYMDNYPEGTRYFFGHGRELNKNDLRKYYSDFMKIYEIAKNTIKSGKTAKEAAECDEIKQFDNYAKIFPDLKGNWLRAVEFSIKKNPILPSICEPITKAMMDEGMAKALELYSKMKQESADKYNFSEGQLNTLAYELIKRKMLKEALEVLKLNAQIFPDSSNVFDSLGEIQMLLGMKQDSLISYKRSLELNPENANAAEKIRELTAK